MHFSAVVFAFLATAVAQALAASNSGFTVSGTDILDAHGTPFIMRGINFAHNWFKDHAPQSIPAIAATGANVVRIVLSDGDMYEKDDAATVQSLIDLCEENKLVAILEVHDGTGLDDVQRLEHAADYWISMASIMQGKEDRVIINIANEWMGSSGKAASWADGYKSVIPRMRAAGLKNMIIVDSAGWGQDASCIAQQGHSILQADPLKNTAFSIHMYEVAAPDMATIKKHIDNSLAAGVALIIGEFSNAQNGKPVDYKSIMEYCSKRNIGWLVWSWFGNNADTINMDLVDGPAGALTPIGKEIIEGNLGVRSTVKPNSLW